MAQEMMTAPTGQRRPWTVAKLLEGQKARERFTGVLGEAQGQAYIASLLSLVNTTGLNKCKPETVLTAAQKAAVLNLPIEPSLGFSYIIPYKDEAQFQIGYKGLVQLALRSNQVKKLTSGKVYVNQFKRWNPQTETLTVDWSRTGEGEVAGYFAMMRLTNGFTKTIFWTLKQVQDHRKRFSKAGSGSPWNSDFDAMAQKTLLKALLGKFAPLTPQLQQAVAYDDQTEFDNENPPDDVETISIDDIQLVDNGQTPVRPDEDMPVYDTEFEEMTDEYAE